MRIRDFTSIIKKRTWFLYSTVITVLLLIFVLFVNSESDAKKKAVKGILVAIKLSAKGPNNTDLYFVDECGNMRNLTNYLGLNNDPSWSPDGKRITFRSNRNGRWGLYMMDADGLNQLPLYCPDKSLLVFPPAWRPDGKRIAFYVFDDSKHGDSGYKIIDVTEPITETVRFDIELQKKMPDNLACGLVWSPDGKKIAFIKQNQIGSEQKDDILFVMDSDGKNKRELISFGMIYYDSPVWSPDSKKIVFVSTKVDAIGSSDITDIYTIDVDNLSVTNLTKGKNLPFTEHRMPTWSPDSKQIAFVSISPYSADRTCGGGISVINTETLELKRLTEHVMDSHPSWSSDGDKIAFLSNREIDLTRKRKDPFVPMRVYLMDTGGKNIKRLTNFEHPDDKVSSVSRPAWSPVK